MPRNYNRDEEDYSVTRPVRHQRSRASGDFDDSDQEETSYRRRSVQQRYRRDHSDSEGDDDRPIQEQRRGKSRFDEMEVRKPRRQPERDSSFVPRTLQPSENRIRTSTSSSSAWSESHKDNWAEKENFRADEYSKPKPWARATETGDRSNPFKKSSRFADEDEDFAGHTPVEEYVEPVRRNKARPPPPKSQYQPYHLREEDDVTAPSANENPASPSSLHSKDETHFNDTDEVNDQDSTSNQSLPTDDDDASPPTNYLEQYPSKNPPHPSAFSQNGGCKYGLPFTVPFIHLCPLKGENSSLVQCLIVRNREDLGNKLYPTYSLYLEDKNKLLIVAKKMSFNSTSNYHLFDRDLCELLPRSTSTLLTLLLCAQHIQANYPYATRPTPYPTPYPTDAPTSQPSLNPTPYPTTRPSFRPTPYPTHYPTDFPTSAPTDFPTPRPSPRPSSRPSPRPTPYPTSEPTPYPTDYPSNFPTYRPSPYPSPRPSRRPTPYPTPYPTDFPTDFPTRRPSPFPTRYPTQYPTSAPTPYPTFAPSPPPTAEPTSLPSTEPTTTPSVSPSSDPSSCPSLSPTQDPTLAPSSSPTIVGDTLAPTPPPSIPNDDENDDDLITNLSPTISPTIDGFLPERLTFDFDIKTDLILKLMIAAGIASMLTLLAIQFCYGSLTEQRPVRRGLDGSGRGLLYDPLDLDRSVGSGSRHGRLLGSSGPQYIELRPGGGGMREDPRMASPSYPRPAPHHFRR